MDALLLLQMGWCGCTIVVMLTPSHLRCWYTLTMLATWTIRDTYSPRKDNAYSISAHVAINVSASQRDGQSVHLHRWRRNIVLEGKIHQIRNRVFRNQHVSGLWMPISRTICEQHHSVNNKVLGYEYDIIACMHVDQRSSFSVDIIKSNTHKCPSSQNMFFTFMDATDGFHSWKKKPTRLFSVFRLERNTIRNLFLSFECVFSSILFWTICALHMHGIRVLALANQTRHTHRI